MTIEEVEDDKFKLPGVLNPVRVLNQNLDDFEKKMYEGVKNLLKPYETKFNSHELMFKVIKDSNDLIFQKISQFESTMQE